MTSLFPETLDISLGSFPEKDTLTISLKVAFQYLFYKPYQTVSLPAFLGGTRTVISISTTLFLLSIACTIVANYPVLYLNAADNPAHPKAWKNLGTEGGELLEADKAPELEEGTIKIPALGINEQNVKYYTTKETFGGPPAKNTRFLRIDVGVPFRRDASFRGFPEQSEGRQEGMFIVGGQNLDISIHAKGGKQGVQPLNLKLEEGVWTWIRAQVDCV